MLNPISPKSDYTFSNYTVGASNDIAHSIARSIAEEPESAQYCPTVIYGGIGVGKTHLLHAIGNLCSSTDILITTGSNWVLNFISAIQQNRTVQFAKRCQGASVLLFDDIDSLEDKKQSAREFHRTLNHYILSAKNIVLTSTKHPTEITGFDDRFVSQLASGVAVEIKPPDKATLQKILADYSYQLQIPLAPDVSTLLMDLSGQDIRQLKSVLHLLRLHNGMQESEVDHDRQKQIIIDSHTRYEVRATEERKAKLQSRRGTCSAG